MTRRRLGPRWIAWLLAPPLAVIALYAIAVFAGARIPVNADFRPAGEGIPVIVIDNGIHVDFVLPTVVPGHDWRTVFDPAATRRGASLGETEAHVVIGWGHRDFYIGTPSWDDLSARTVMRALVGVGGSVMHVSYEWPWIDDGNSAMLLLPPDDYGKLAKALLAAVVTGPDGRAIPVDATGYSDIDAFYEARGSYNALYTCNNWAASVLVSAGVRAPLWSPFSGAVIDQILAARR